MIHADALGSFKAEIKQKISDLNQEHSRCKSIDIEFYQCVNSDIITLTGIYCVNVKIYPIYHEYN